MAAPQEPAARRQRPTTAAGRHVARRAAAANPGPSGLDLVHRLRVEADRRGELLSEFVAPLAREPRRFIRQLRSAARPTPATIARVAALIAGEPLPERLPPATGAYGPGFKPAATEAQEKVEFQRALAEEAARFRRPGETLHDAQLRLERELELAA
jgi:hypothetical protein